MKSEMNILITQLGLEAKGSRKLIATPQ
jgi:hypothetical protein